MAVVAVAVDEGATDVVDVGDVDESDEVDELEVESDGDE